MDTVFTGHRENTHFTAISRSPQEDLDEGEREWSEASSSSVWGDGFRRISQQVDGVMTTMEWSDDCVDDWEVGRRGLMDLFTLHLHCDMEWVWNEESVDME